MGRDFRLTDVAGVVVDKLLAGSHATYDFVKRVHYFGV